MKDITIFKIDKEIEAIEGDYVEFSSYRPDELIVCNNHSNILYPLDNTFNVECVVPERVVYNTPFNQYEEYLCVDPRDRAKILSLIEQSEINRWKDAKQTVEKLYHEQKELNKKLTQESVFSKLTSLFKR